MSQAIIHMPVAPNEPFNVQLQPALEVVFGATWRIALASACRVWVGDFVNAYVMAKMKLLTKGRWLWTRTIGSTIIGEGVDSLTFYPIAFLGIWESQTVVKVIAFNWTMKVIVETVLTPVTYLVVGFLKRRENVDTFDTTTSFNPFSLRDRGRGARVSLAG